jgi:hypothetical protein
VSFNGVAAMSSPTSEQIIVEKELHILIGCVHALSILIQGKDTRAVV